MTDANGAAAAQPDESASALDILAEGADPEEEAASAATVTFPSGAKLPMRDAAALLRKRPCYVVAIVGPYDSGKTSLVAGLYDLFQEGPIEGVEFVGSKTIRALEMASHHSRIASGRRIPDSERTPVGKAGFYHLDVAMQAGAPITLLLGDRAGEEYRNAGDDVDLAIEFPELARANMLAFLVDGERLVDIETRHNVTAQVETMLRAFIEAGVTSNIQYLALVLTKLDVVQASTQAKAVTECFHRFLDRVRTKYGSHFAAIEPFPVAAAPRVDGLKRGTGIADLLKFWIASPRFIRTTRLETDDKKSVPSRAIGRISVVGPAEAAS